MAPLPLAAARGGSGAGTRHGVRPDETAASPDEVRRWIAREGGTITSWRSVGGRRHGLNVHGKVVVDLPDRTTHTQLPHVIMYRRRPPQLTARQFAAAEALHRDFLAAGSWPDGAINWERFEEALSLRYVAKAGQQRLGWPPRKPSERVRRGPPKRLGPPGGGCLDANRRVASVLDAAGVVGAHLLLWVICEGRTCQEWVNVRNANSRDDEPKVRRDYATGLLRDSLDTAAELYHAAGLLDRIDTTATGRD